VDLDKIISVNLELCLLFNQFGPVAWSKGQRSPGAVLDSSHEPGELSQWTPQPKKISS